MSDPKRPTPSTVHRPAVALALGVTLLLALAAFVLSFVALSDLAARSGVPAQLSWLWPLVVDGTIIASTGALVAMAGHDARARHYPWALLVAGSAISVAGNAVHAVLVSDTALPPVVAALVASVPPLALLALTHLSVSLVQRQAPKGPCKPRRTVPAAPAETVAPAAEASPVAESAPRRALAAVPTPATGGTPSVAEREVQRAEAVRLREEGLSFGQIAARIDGPSVSTIKRWCAA